MSAVVVRAEGGRPRGGGVVVSAVVVRAEGGRRRGGGVVMSVVFAGAVVS
ncbi:hypothetical protein ABZU32_04575 [Sphaerisporangium sp. NPDC005288]